ncbi:MAG TPA: MlaD family protein [Thermoanaerobaculia bacterium]|jgi:phospholipid/cholesterol/gamma-HCH transport system substrate-binding protein|nr:MlaD family protein [Thermoanaerobaculia bacterium]
MGNVIRVGLFTAICLAILGLLIWKIEDWSPWGAKGKEVSAVFDSVAGLDDKAAVRVAGVRVGRVDGIGLEGRQAKVRMVLEKPLDLTEGTTATIANLGLLGEKYVELIPGPAGAPPLPPNAVLPGTTPISFDQAMAKIQAIGDSIQGITGSLSGALAGETGGVSLGQLMTSLAQTSDEIRLLVAENRAQVGRTIGNFEQVGASLASELPRLSAQLQETAQQISAILAENRGNLSGTMQNARKVSADIQVSVDNLNKITDKIASGQGTIGKLVNDETAHDKLVSTLDSIEGGVKSLSSSLGALQKFKLDLDLQSYYLSDPKESQSTFRLDIEPGEGNKVYRAALSNTPGGKLRTKTQVFTTTNPDGSREVKTVETLTREDTRVASALFGYKAPSNLRIWAGLIENTGGASVELPFDKDKFLLSFDAFDFNRENDQNPHLRLTGRWQLHPNIYLVGGLDDPLENESLFLGAGVKWRDDNLKYLLGSVPKF